MTRRLIIGKRGAEAGIWLSKPGIDAEIAGAADLLLAITGAAEQLILFGSANVFPATIILGLSQRPFVFLSTRAPGPPEVNDARVIENSYWRPFPFDTFANHNAQADVSPASMTITAASAATRLYMVFRRRFN